MSDFLGSVLDESVTAAEPVDVEHVPVEEVENVDEPQVEQEAETQDTGVETSPPEVNQDDAKKRQGIEAALLAERRKRQELEAELAKLKTAEQKPNQATDREPQLEDFESYEEYTRAIARYELRQELKAEKEREQQQAAESRQQREQADIQTAVQATIARGQAAHSDFDEAINTGLAPFLSDNLIVALAHADNGHEVAYHLAKDVSEAKRIAELPPAKMMIEIGKLDVKLAPKPAEAVQKPVLPQTLTQTRNAAGRYESPSGYNGPTPLDDVLGRKT